MTLMEGFQGRGLRDLRDNLYGSDQCYIDYPCRFLLLIQLVATNGFRS